MGLRGRLLLKDEICFFVTTTVMYHAKVFLNKSYCELLLRNIKHYQQRYRFDILGYVIMPSHFHWIVEVHSMFGSISDIMRDIKKYSAWDIMEAIERDGEINFTNLFTLSAEKFKSQRRKLWMSRFDDQVIQNEPMLLAKLDYIHNNPVKAGMIESPEEYLYSSARNYIKNDHSIIKVKTEWR
jgi:putative transposase